MYKDTHVLKQHLHTDISSSPCPLISPSLPRAKQAPSSFNVSSSIDPLLKPLPWVGIGQIQSHTRQFITEPRTLSLTVGEGGGETDRREGEEMKRGETRGWRKMEIIEKEELMRKKAERLFSYPHKASESDILASLSITNSFTAVAWQLYNHLFCSEV